MSRTAIMDAMERLRKECLKWKIEVELHALFRKDSWQEGFDWKFGEQK